MSSERHYPEKLKALTCKYSKSNYVIAPTQNQPTTNRAPHEETHTKQTKPNKYNDHEPTNIQPQQNEH